MAINYPTSLDNDTSLPPVVDDVDDVLAVHQNDKKAAIIAIETKIGTGDSTPTNGKVLMGTGTGTSGWSDLPPGGIKPLKLLFFGL